MKLSWSHRYQLHVKICSRSRPASLVMQQSMINSWKHAIVQKFLMNDVAQVGAIKKWKDERIRMRYVVTLLLASIGLVLVKTISNSGP